MPNVIVTHQAPDLDAIGATWLLKRFDSQHYGDAKVLFTPAGTTLDPNELTKLDFTPEKITHVDTGKGEFDHHQPERGHLKICASSLVYSDHLCKLHPELQQDEALQAVIAHITEIDHFQEIFWPEASHDRYAFQLHEIIQGLETLKYHDNDSQLHFGMTCLDAVYGKLKNSHAAEKSIGENGQPFMLGESRCLAILTRNDDVIKLAQKAGYVLVVKKDTETGHVRIKARPDAAIDLTILSEKIKAMDPHADWYNHPSGKMLLNSSNKTAQKPSQLSLETLVATIKETYATA